MRKSLSLSLLPVLALGGCALFGVGGDKESASDFGTARNAPLVIPPDFTLTPPVAGTASGASEAQQQAIDVLFGGPAPRSQTETSLLDQAGRDRASVGARSTAGDPDTQVVDLGPVTRTILAADAVESQVASAQIP